MTTVNFKDSIAFKLSIALLFLPVLFTMVGFFHFQQIESRRINRFSEIKLRQLEKVTTALMINYRETFKERTLRLASDNQIIVPYKLNVHFQLKERLSILYRQNGLESLAVITPEGKVIATAGEKHFNDIHAASYLKQFNLALAASNSTFFCALPSRQLGIASFTPVLSGRKVIAVLYMTKRVRLEHAFYNCVLISHAQIQSVSSNATFLKALVPEATPIDDFARLKLANKELFVSKIPIPGFVNSDYYLIAGYDERQTFKEKREIARFAGIISLAVFVLMVFYAIILSKQMTKPISRLVDISKAISSNNNDVKWLNPRKDEIGILSESLKTMTEALQNTIQERLQAENELKESEDKLQSIFKAAPTGIGFEKGRILEIVNEKLSEITGYTAEELIGKSGQLLYLDEDEYKRVLKLADSQIRKIGTGTVETMWRRKSGETINVLLSATPLDRMDLARGIAFTVLDITDLRKNETALSESEQKYRSTMDAMKDLVFVCSQDYKVEYMNTAMIDKVGHDATGKKCYKVINNLIDKCSWCPGEKIQDGEFGEQDIKSSKDNRSYHISHTPIIHADGAVSKMAVFRDTTDLKKMEERPHKGQKMESIGTLAGGIAHDFNNILFPILGYTELLLMEVPDDSPLRNSLQEILAGATRARELVTQILTFSRQTEHELKPVNICLIVEEALKLIRSSLPATIDIQQVIDHKCGNVLADTTQIHQVVMNLVTNAYHAMLGQGGKLTVSLKQNELPEEVLDGSISNHDTYICLSVADRGTGIQPDVLSRIFDPYFTTKTADKGTGLGLAVVQGIVEKHGGHILVNTEIGSGTEFQVFLPVLKTKAAFLRKVEHQPLETGNEHVLLVDDEPAIVRMIKQMLETMGYQVTGCTNSLEALKIFSAKPETFDLVVTDMTMPSLTGDQLSLKLFEIRPDLPIILLTGFSETISRNEALSLGIKEFLIKPVVMQKLSVAARKALGKQIPVN